MGMVWVLGVDFEILGFWRFGSGVTMVSRSRNGFGVWGLAVLELWNLCYHGIKVRC